MFYIEDDAIYITRKDDAALEIDVLYADQQVYTLEPNDVLTLTVRELPTAQSPALISISAPPGSGRIIIRSEDTAGIEPGRYSADIQLTDGNGDIYTVWPDLEGNARYRIKNFRNFIIMPEVTDA